MRIELLALLPSLLLAALLETAAAAPVSLRIIAINDLHGHLEPGDNAIAVPDPASPGSTRPLRSGGLAYLATRVRSLQAEVPHSVLVSAGDLIGASPLVSALFRDEPTVEAMNLLGLALNAVGNHEFDQGVAELRRIADGGCAPTARGEMVTCAHPSGRYAGARFPLLAANVTDADGRSLLPASHVIEVAGARIGFIGAVTRSTPGMVMPTGIRGWRFGEEAAAINREALRLRADGVQALVAVVHEGGDADGGINGCERPAGPVFDIARALDPAIAIVFSAHTHRAYNCRIDSRLVIQGASFGRLVSVVDLQIDGGRIDPVSIVARNLPVPNGRDAETDELLRAAFPPLAAAADIDALIAHYRERAAPLAQRPIGRIAASFDRRASAGGDHAAGRLIADAHLAATRGNGAQIAFTNPGGVRSDLLARPPDGMVSFADAFTMQPFGNALVTLTLTGVQLKQLLESQWNRAGVERARMLQPSHGFSYAWAADRPPGARVDPESMRLDGERIRPERRYRVTVNSFLAAGGDGFSVLRDGADATGGPLDVDALADYLRTRSRDGPHQPDRTARIRRLRE